MNLYDERAKVWASVQELRERVSGATEARGEDNDALAKALDEFDSLTRSIQSEDRAKQLEGVAGLNGGTEAPVARKVAEVDKEAAYRDAFGAYLRGGESKLTGEQRSALATRAQATSPGSAGGYLIPTDTLNTMTESLKAFGGILGVANVINTSSGNPVNWPSNDDTGNVGAILPEGTQVTETAITFGQKTLGAYTYTSKLILVNWQLLQDSMFNVENFVARKAGERIGRAVSAHLATGTGTDQPQGLFVGATTGKTGAAGQVTSVTYADLLDLKHSIDPAYRGRARWVMSDQAVKMVSLLTDANDHALWQPALTAGEPDRLLGYPVTIDQGVAAPAASAKSIGFGDVNAAYVVRQVSGGTLVTMRERYADYLQNGYFAFLRLDAKVDDAGAFKVYAHPAA